MICQIPVSAAADTSLIRALLPMIVQRARDLRPAVSSEEGHTSVSGGRVSRNPYRSVAVAVAVVFRRVLDENTQESEGAAWMV